MRFRTKTVLGVAIIEMVLLAVLISSALSVLKDSNETALANRVKLGSKLLASAAKEAVLAQDLATLDSLVKETIASGQIDSVRILDANGIVLAQQGDAAILAHPFHKESQAGQSPDEIFDWSESIKAGGIQYGEVRLSVSTAPLRSLLSSAKNWAAGIAGLEMLLVAIFSWLLGTYLARQLVELRNASARLSAGEFDYRIPVTGSDELADTASAFNRMAHQLGESHSSLQQENQMRLETMKRLEFALAQTEDRTEQLNAIFSLSPDGFIAFDQNVRIKYANPAFFQMTSFKENEIIGLDEANFSEKLAQRCVPTAKFLGIEALKTKLETSLSASPESDRNNTERPRQLIELAAPNKREIEIGIRESDARTVSQILYFRDVTHEKAVDHMKSEFLATAAHELRTPLSSIYGYAEILLARQFPPAEIKQFLGIIYDQASQMVLIINELLDLARIESRQGKDFNYSRLDLGQLLSDVIGSFKLPEQRPPLSWKTEPDCWIRADKDKLTQAINNVLSNAIKYSSEETTVSVELVTSDTTEDPALHYGIRISDQGIGMTPEQLSRVFERFYRADSSGSIPGTGLGMSITKEILELHGGKVEIKSEPKIGTQVTLWIAALKDD